MKFIVTTTEKLKQLLALKKKLSQQEIIEYLDAIGVYMVGSVRKNFELGGRPKFTPLKPETLKKKRGESILVDSGALSLGVIHEVDEEEPAVYIGPSGPSTKYGPTHNFGDETRGIPERTFLIMQQEDNVYINNFVGNSVMV
jgi:phage gpG-like protein